MGKKGATLNASLLFALGVLPGMYVDIDVYEYAG